jgi:hypothetical protein
MGLYANPRRLEERGPSGGTLDDRPDLEGTGHTASARAADVLVDVSASALGRDRGGRFFHHRSLDLAQAAPTHTVGS